MRAESWNGFTTALTVCKNCRKCRRVVGADRCIYGGPFEFEDMRKPISEKPPAPPMRQLLPPDSSPPR